MKLFKYGLPFAALALLASCANDNIDQPNGGENQTPADGKMYVSVNIAMPNTLGTKAVDSYVEGVAGEYAASTGKILLFTKDEPGEDYSFFASADLASLAWGNHSDGEITTSSTTATAEFNSIEESATYYGIVVLNSTSDFPIPTSTTTKYSEWKKMAHSQVGDLGSFVMTNAPGAVVGEEAFSTDKEPATLVEIDGSAFGTSPLNLAPAATFYVQREVAKVTLDQGSGDKALTKFKVKTPANYEGTDYVKFTLWDLDYTNTSVYPVQNVEKFTEWLAIEDVTPASFYGSAAQKFVRVWWAEDPNYDQNSDEYSTEDGGQSPFNELGNKDVASDLAKVFYPMENTMDAEHMQRGQTTTAVLKGTYYIDPKGSELPASGKSFITYGTIKKEVPANVTPKVSTGQSQVPLSTIFSDAKSGDEKSDLDIVMEDLGVTTDVTVDYYHNGAMYYAIPIRHFDDNESPDLTTDENYAEWKDARFVYPEKYTGRYGLLRNNWYELTINSITGLGSPTKPTPEPEDPDDPKDKTYYINATINILGWAKRGHNYDL